MNPALLLSWFPIILAIGMAGRLLDRSKALKLGAICAVFWVFLLHALYGGGIWDEVMRVLAVLAGASAIVAMGAWSGEMAMTPAKRESGASQGSRPRETASSHEDAGGLTPVSAVLDQFNGWLEEHRNDLDPWPGFDEFIRTVLYQNCKATHVKPFRLFCDGDELLPLRETDPFSDVPRISARRGIVGHVISTARAYLDGDPLPDELRSKAAAESEESLAWCFPIMQGPRRIGVVTAGQLGIAPESGAAPLRSMERLISLFWGMLCETCRSRVAGMNDPVSKLYTREAFARVAEETLDESYRTGEPVALAVIALEQLRELSDTGRWELADDLVFEAGSLLRSRMRADDRLGRFDGSRFLVLLRRVDSELATLILEQILVRLETLVGDKSRWGAAIAVRCGVVESGMEKPDLRTLISEAVAQCHKARTEGKAICGEIYSTVAAVGAAS